MLALAACVAFAVGLVTPLSPADAVALAAAIATCAIAANAYHDACF